MAFYHKILDYKLCGRFSGAILSMTSTIYGLFKMFSCSIFHIFNSQKESEIDWE